MQMLPRLSHDRREQRHQLHDLSRAGPGLCQRADEPDGSVRPRGVPGRERQVQEQLRGPDQLRLCHQLGIPQQERFRQEVIKNEESASSIHAPDQTFHNSRT